MFFNFKKHVLASRIRKACVPTNCLQTAAMRMYTNVFTKIFGAEQQLLEESLAFVNENAETIAEVILLCHPLIKKFQEAQIIEHFKSNLQGIDEDVQPQLEEIEECSTAICEIFEEEE